MILNLDEFNKVEGEIYKIQNIVTGKYYIGQTRSHRLNHAKYRPFGYLGRFKDHINEANSNKKNQSRYLNSSLLKYGSENFICEKILSCPLEDLDSYESHYIIQYNSKYPNGYNLTNGGQMKGCSKGEKITLNDSEIVKPIIKPKGVIKKSEFTKNLISKRLKECFNTKEVRNKRMIKAQNQHLNKKFDRYKDVTIDENDIEKYIHEINSYKKNEKYVRIIINKIRTSFVGKYETIEQIKERARNFIKELIKWQCDQIAGNSIESSLPLTTGNVCEELG
jgi:hypothetical protein